MPEKEIAEFWSVSMHLEEDSHYFCILYEQLRNFDILNSHCGLIS